MAAPTVGALGTYRQGSTNTPAFAAPASVVSTSIVVIDFFLDGATTISALPDASWQHAPGSPLYVNVNSHSLNRIWARNPAGGSYTVTLSGSAYSAGQASRADGCVTSGSPWDTNSGTGTAVATDATNGTATPAVSMTTQNNDQLGWFTGTDWSGGTWTPSTGWTEQMDSGDGVVTLNTKTLTTAGGTGSVSATCTGSDKRGALLGSLLSTALGGGTTYNQSASGGITPTGALARQAGKLAAGGITPAAALVRQAQKRLTGNLAPAGALVRAAAKVLGGVLTPAGVLVRRTAKAFGGALTPAGAAATLKAAIRSFSGSITPTGALTRSTAKALGGTLAPTGSLRRVVARTLVGTLGTAGALAKATAKRFLGAITPAGLVTPSTGPVQNITLTVRPPEGRWTTAPPGGRWAMDNPDGRWTAGPPEG